MFVKLLIFILLSFVSLFILPHKGYAAVSVGNGQYYGTNADIPSSIIIGDSRCTDQCGIQTYCWNSWAAGQTNCPDPSIPQACSSNQSAYFGVSTSWTKFFFSSGTYCGYDSNNSTIFNTVCIPLYLKSANTYSTADKYDSSNPPVMDYGTCDGNVGAPYKTCCSGTTPVGANHYPLDPYPPDEADCGGNTTVTCQQPSCVSNTFCKDPGIQCGQAACSQLGTPPPSTAPTCSTALSCSNSTCPTGYTITPVGPGTYACANSSGTIDCTVTPYCPSACPAPTSTTSGWTGETCQCGSGNVPQTCATNPTLCNSCSLKYCLKYSDTQCCYYKDPTCFNDSNNCQNINCGANGCIPGSTQTTCSAANVCSY